MDSHLAQINKDRYNSGRNFTYQDNKWHKVRIGKSLKIIGKYQKEKEGNLKILDIGCGDGAIGKMMIDMGLETYGIDVSTDELKKAEERGLKIAEGDIHKPLPYEDNFFDIIFMGEVVEHIADPRDFIKEINRIMKVGGLLVVTTPNLAGFDNRLRLMSGRIPRCIDPLSGHHYLHVRPFTFSSLEKFLKRGGFEVNYFTSNRVKLGFVDSYSLADIFPGLGATLIVGAIKKSNIDKFELNET